MERSRYSRYRPSDLAVLEGDLKVNKYNFWVVILWWSFASNLVAGELVFHEIVAPREIHHGAPGKVGYEWLEGYFVGKHWVNFVDKGVMPHVLFHQPTEGWTTEFVCVVSLESGNSRWFSVACANHADVQIRVAFEIDSSRTAIEYHAVNKPDEVEFAIVDFSTMAVIDAVPPRFQPHVDALWMRYLPAAFTHSFANPEEALLKLNKNLHSEAWDIRTAGDILQDSSDEFLFFIPTLNPPVPVIDNGGNDKPRIVFFATNLLQRPQSILLSKSIEERCEETSCNYLIPPMFHVAKSSALHLAGSFKNSALHGIRVRDGQVEKTFKLDFGATELVLHTTSPSERYHAFYFMNQMVVVHDYETERESSMKIDSDGNFLGITDDSELVISYLDYSKPVVLRTFGLVGNNEWRVKLEFSFPRNADN
jgi:hypothetical protein